MRILIGALASLMLISCASVKRGPSPYSASWEGEVVTRADSKVCPPDQSYLKMKWKDLVTQASQCVRANNYFQVERVATHLAKIEPESHWGAYFLSLAAESRKDLPRAFWMIELALKKAPEDGILLYQRARLHWDRGNKDLALKDLEEAVDKNASLIEAHLLLAQVQFIKDDLGGAQKSFTKVLARDSRRAEALFGLGEIAFKKKNYDEAYSFHKRASERNPRLGVSFMRMAQIQELHYKDLAASLEAYKDLQRRVSLNRVDGDVPVNLNEKMKNLDVMIKQTVAQNKASEKKLSKREPSGKVSE